jgi:hypothetical protein
MITAYALCAIIGGLFVLFAALMGAGDHDADAHLEIDTHADLEIHADPDLEVSQPEVEIDTDTDPHLDDMAVGSWLPFLSLRFWTYGVAAFGVTGLLLTWLTPPSAGLTALLSAATGLTAGTAMSWLTHYLRRAQTDSRAAERDFLGTVGRVLTPLSADRAGKVRCRVHDELIDVIAVGARDLTLTEGTEVVVTDYRDSRAVVVRTGLDAVEDGLTDKTET